MLFVDLHQSTKERFHSPESPVACCAVLHRLLHEQVRAECIWVCQSVSYKSMRDTYVSDFCMVRL